MRPLVLAATAMLVAGQARSQEHATAPAPADPHAATAPVVDPHAASAPVVDPHAVTAPATETHDASLAEQTAEPVGEAAIDAASDILLVPGGQAAAPAADSHHDDAHAAGEAHAAEHGAAAHDEHAAHGAAAHDEHGGSHALVTPAQIFNFALFFGVLAWLLGKPLAGFLRQRRAAIADSLAEAEQAERDAKAKLAAMESRLQSLEGEVNAILDSARQQAAAEKALLLERAQADATRVLSQAEAQVGEMEQAAARRLRTVAAELAVDMAREIVEKQMSPDDRRRVFDRALKALPKTGSQA